MKKLLLAVAVSSVVAGSANAATIYEKDGFTYKLNGDFQVQLRQDVGNDQNPEIEFDDLELKNYVSYDLGNGLTGFGRVDFGFKDAAEDDGDAGALEEAYVGMKYEAVSFSFGKQNFASDEFGVEESYEDVLGEDQFDNIATDGDDTLRLDVGLDQAYLAASYEMDAEGEDSENGEYFDLFASTELAGLTLGVAYQNATPSIDAESFDTWGVSATYDFDIATIGADYSVTDETDAEPEQTLLNVVTTFDVASTTGVALGMRNYDKDDNSFEDVSEWYANVTYKFPAAKNFRMFAEIADTDEDDVDMGYLAGVRVKF
ncbi:porin [Ectothiorhodospira mobilis]|nr:porin [Ectothiorhodospira mobilis]